MGVKKKYGRYPWKETEKGENRLEDIITIMDLVEDDPERDEQGRPIQWTEEIDGLKITHF